MATIALYCAAPVMLIAQNGGAPASPSMSMFFLPLLIIGLLYYVMILRPDQTQHANHKTALDELKQNDRVITAGGIHGVVVKATTGSSEIVIRIDESTNTKIHIQRSSISRIVTDKDKTDSKES